MDSVICDCGHVIPLVLGLMLSGVLLLTNYCLAVSLTMIRSLLRQGGLRIRSFLLVTIPCLVILAAELAALTSEKDVAPPLPPASAPG